MIIYMKNILLVFCLLFIGISHAAVPNWGKTGHRATAEIAMSLLSKKAKKNMDALLDGETAVLLSTYPDDIKSDPSYDKYGVWHYINIPEGKNYDDVKENVGPNIIWALERVKAGLKDEATPKEKKKFYLTMLIHLIGDLHQPMHIGRPEDLGGNRIIVFWFGEPSNLHKVWDSDMLDSFKMSYSEIAANQKRLSDQEIKEIQKGDVLDWLEDNYKITNEIYNSAQNGYRLGYEYMYDWMPVVREQIQKGGIRLAKELNDIFG